MSLYTFLADVQRRGITCERVAGDQVTFFSQSTLLSPAASAKIGGILTKYSALILHGFPPGELIVEDGSGWATDDPCPWCGTSLDAGIAAGEVSCPCEACGFRSAPLMPLPVRPEAMSFWYSTYLRCRLWHAQSDDDAMAWIARGHRGTYSDNEIRYMRGVIHREEGQAMREKLQGIHQLKMALGGCLLTQAGLYSER